jgi:N-acetylneuraminic acid mutarotase
VLIQCILGSSAFSLVDWYLITAFLGACNFDESFLFEEFAKKVEQARVVKKGTIKLVILVGLFVMSNVIFPNVGAEDNFDGVWTPIAPLQTSRRFIGVATVDGNIFAIGGVEEFPGTDHPRVGYKIVEMYDPLTDKWVTKNPMPELAAPRVAVYQNKIFCISLGLNQVYDVTTDNWELKTPSPTKRNGGAAASVAGKIYLVGGTLPGPTIDETPGDIVPSDVTEMYDPESDSWTIMAPMLKPVKNPTAVTVDSIIYVFGDIVVQKYNTQTNQWTLGPDMIFPIQFVDAGAVATTGVNAPKRIYVFHYKLIHVFDPEADKWIQIITSVPETIESGIISLNDELYLIGGAVVEDVIKRDENGFDIVYKGSSPPTKNYKFTPKTTPESTNQNGQPITSQNPQSANNEQGVEIVNSLLHVTKLLTDNIVIVAVATGAIIIAAIAAIRYKSKFQNTK